MQTLLGSYFIWFLKSSYGPSGRKWHNTIILLLRILIYINCALPPDLHSSKPLFSQKLRYTCYHVIPLFAIFYCISVLYGINPSTNVMFKKLHQPALDFLPKIISSLSTPIGICAPVSQNYYWSVLLRVYSFSSASPA